jgi:hypothetical protein
MLVFWGILQLWFRSDPDKPIFNLYIEQWKYWRKQRRRYWEQFQLPEIKLKDLEHGQRIIVVGFNNQGPVCRKILHSTEFHEFVLVGYECTEKIKIHKQVYEVQHSGNEIHLEYCSERFIRSYIDPVPMLTLAYKNYNNRPIIRAA